VTGYAILPVVLVKLMLCNYIVFLNVIYCTLICPTPQPLGSMKHPPAQLSVHKPSHTPTYEYKHLKESGHLLQTSCFSYTKTEYQDAVNILQLQWSHINNQ
jgi:hypothetical protein